MLSLKLLLKRKSVLVIFGLVVVGGGYLTYRATRAEEAAPQYLTGQIERGTLTVSVSGTGQVSASTQVEVTPRVSGEVTQVLAASDQEVAASDVLIQLDTREAQKAIRDAEANLESSQLALDKLQQPPSDLSLLQAENALLQAQESKAQAEAKLAKAYEDGFNTVADVFLDLPTVMAGLHEAILGNTLYANQANKDYYADAIKVYDEAVLQYAREAHAAYLEARTAYDANFDRYKLASRNSASATVETLINETYATTKIIAEAVKTTSNLIQFYQDKLTERNLKPNTQASAYLASLNTSTGQTSAHLLSLFSIRQTIQTSKEDIVNAGRTIEERTTSLEELRAGPDGLDVKAQQLTLKQREYALQDARDKLYDYTVRAPFAGLITNLAVRPGDTVSTGTAVATLLTKQQLAEVSLNEVDVAKVRVGQKAVLTFDALEELSLTGQVVEVATLGTVSQGVVSYTVKVSFDTQAERVKPGMSVSASIITDVVADVLLVPSAAVKSQNGFGTYVEVLQAGGALERRQVQVGLSNDTKTQIEGEVEVGERVVTQTITQSATPARPQGSTGGFVPVGGTFIRSVGGVR